MHMGTEGERVLSFPQYPWLMRPLVPYIFLPEYIIKNQSPFLYCAWMDHLSLAHLQWSLHLPSLSPH